MRNDCHCTRTNEDREWLQRASNWILYLTPWIYNRLLSAETTASVGPTSKGPPQKANTLFWYYIYHYAR